jgi:hypothetical protein
LHDRDKAVVTHKGLVPTADIDDGQAPVPDGDSPLGLVPDSFVIGSPVPQRLRHGVQNLLRLGSPGTIPVTEDATHGQVFSDNLRWARKPRTRRRTGCSK